MSIAPSVEMVVGHGTPPTAEALAHGLRPSLSIDVVTTVPGDMSTQMRFLFATDRLTAHEAAFAAGNVEEPPLLTSREVLEFATIEGARVCGLADRTGSLTAGKQADLVLERGGELVGVDLAGAHDRAGASLDHLLAETQTQPNWVQSRVPERTYS